MRPETRAIWKYPLRAVSNSKINMPLGAKVLTAQMQAGHMCLWALVWPHLEAEVRTFAVYGTGHPIPASPGKYVGTVQELGGALVWHVFDVSEAHA